MTEKSGRSTLSKKSLTIFETSYRKSIQKETLKILKTQTNMSRRSDNSSFKNMRGSVKRLNIADMEKRHKFTQMQWIDKIKSPEIKMMANEMFTDKFKYEKS